MRTAVIPTDGKYKKEENAKVDVDDIAEANVVQKKKESKRDESFQQEMMYGRKAYKRQVRDTLEEKEARGAHLHDLGHSHRVTMEWDFSREAIEKQVFRLTIGGKTAYLSATELQKYLRWV